MDGSLGVDPRQQVLDTVTRRSALVCTPCSVRTPAGARLAKVPRVIFVHHNPVVVLPASVAAPAGVLAVLANAAMACADVPPLLAVLAQPCEHTQHSLNAALNFCL